jgi:hypothetical protein
VHITNSIVKVSHNHDSSVTHTSRTCRPAFAGATTTLLAEIRAMGYTGSANQLVRHLQQGREQEPLADPRHPAPHLLDHDTLQSPDQRATAHRELTAACLEMTSLTGHVSLVAPKQ